MFQLEIGTLVGLGVPVVIRNGCSGVALSGIISALVVSASNFNVFGGGRVYSLVHALTQHSNVVIVASDSNTNGIVEGRVEGVTTSNGVVGMCIPRLENGRGHGETPSGRNFLNIRKVSGRILRRAFLGCNVANTRVSRSVGGVAGASLFVLRLSNYRGDAVGQGGLLATLGLPLGLSAGTVHSMLGMLFSCSRFVGFIRGRGVLWV